MKLPMVIKQRPPRPVQQGVPSTPSERAQISELVHQFAAGLELVPPVPLEQLQGLTELMIDRHGLDPAWREYLAVLVNNALWRDALAEVPFERRLLLLPKCLRDEEKCPAPFDELGLLCKDCGLCSIEDLQGEAERLGYAVLVAEGSALVMAMIQSGQIEAIVGVSCLSVLEKAFPHTESAAIPCVAVPLLQDDCKDTNVDMDWVWNYIHLSGDDHTRRLDLDGLKRQVSDWFEPEGLVGLFGDAGGLDRTQQLAVDWLARAGKRWRPFLTVCAYQALQEDPHGPLPEDLQRIAVGVECFHKASLIHDDIEDDDDERYGAEAMHAAEGVPVALNVGDLLVGEGYRLLADSGDAAALVRHAAAGHRTLCLGQGAELVWARDPRPLTVKQVLAIYRDKTAPAFEVALLLGAARAGADAEVLSVLSTYSEALGIAYQINDDLDDTEDGGDLGALRPTVLLAIAHERASGEDRALIERAWRREPVATERLRALFEKLDVAGRAAGLMDGYKREAVRALGELRQAGLKGLLRRVIGKIFKLEVEGWCSEFEARNAAGRASGAGAAGGVEPAGRGLRSRPAD